MKNVLIKWFLTLTLLSNLSPAYSETSSNLGVQALSAELRLLLQKEMVAIEAAMKDIVSLNAAGDIEKIAVVAKQIEQSFILKQNLTPEQTHALHTALPADFIQQDETFHYYAGMLEHVAENNKPELINFYYAKLLEACTNCHQAHAAHRFPNFADNTKKIKHEH